MKIALKDIVNLLPEAKHTDYEGSWIYNKALNDAGERQIEVEICVHCIANGFKGMEICGNCNNGLIIRAVNND